MTDLLSVSQSRTSTATTMSPEDVRAFVYRSSAALTKAVKTGDTISYVEQFCAPDFAFHIAEDPQIRHQAEYIQLMNAWHTAFKDMRSEIHEVIVEGDKAVVFETIRYIHSGEFAGLAPTGNKISYQEMAILRLVGDRIREVWLVYDSRTAWEGLMHASH